MYTVSTRPDSILARIDPSLSKDSLPVPSDMYKSMLIQKRHFKRPPHAPLAAPRLGDVRSRKPALLGAVRGTKEVGEKLRREVREALSCCAALRLKVPEGAKKAKKAKRGSGWIATFITGLRPKYNF